MALYETVPGYAVKDVNFYQVDGTNADLSTATKNTTAKLISADEKGFPTKGTIAVYFPSVGDNYASKQDYDKAAATVTAVDASSAKTQEFGTLSNFASEKESEYIADGSYIGRTLPTATFAGSSDVSYYQIMFPVSSASPITLRIDYTLVATDGSGETINIYGAKAVVPATYTKWLPNYAYTYIFKISDNSNGWTSTVTTDPAGLFPITFDAVVAEATDATKEQTTITTVAAPTITTYQQNHAYTTNEYSKATGKNIYVQVMDNRAVPATLVNTLSDANSLLYAVDATHAATATEAQVMDALEKRTATDGETGDITGRNTIVLTKKAINNTVAKIENGVDNQEISVTAGEAAMITITGDGSLDPGTYAYVYDYTTGDKTTVTEYQPLVPTIDAAIGITGVTRYASITTAVLDALTDASNFTADNEAVSTDYIYFSKTTTDGGISYTYSFVSIAGETNLPAGLLKVAKSSASLTKNVNGSTIAVAGTIYFDTYITNNGAYAVKVIKVVD